MDNNDNIDNYENVDNFIDYDDHFDNDEGHFDNDNDDHFDNDDDDCKVLQLKHVASPTRGTRIKSFNCKSLSWKSPSKIAK